MHHVLVRASLRVLILALSLGMLALAPAIQAQDHAKPTSVPETSAAPAHQVNISGSEGEKHEEGTHAEGGHGDVIAHVLEHKVADTPYLDEYPFPKLYLPQFEPVRLAGLTIDFSFTRHLIYLWISAIITIILLWLAAAQNRGKRVPRGFGNMIEAVVKFVRDEIANPVLGHEAKRFLPILLTFFFFIAVSNLVGLLPYGATATGNINMTAAFALLSFAMMIGGGIWHNGVFGFLKGLLPHGIPTALLPLMFVIEIIGLFTKPFALCVRLFANMLSGGLVIGAFYALIFGLHTFIVVPVSLGFLLFMTLLKLFVCLLQAYIFTMLSAFFLGMAVHQEH